MPGRRTDATAADRDAARRAAHSLGTAGLLSQDLAVHWQSITETSRGAWARRHPLTLQAELGRCAFYAWWQARLSTANERPEQPSRLHLRKTSGRTAMRYATLGSTGVKVSCIGLGTATFGAAPLAQEAGRMIGRALDLGINLID